jgi:VWFA-related protein
MLHSLLALTLALLAFAPVVPSQDPPPRPSAADGRTRDVHASVLDAKDAPVTNLSAADFVVREDGASREVLKAVQATAPMQLMVLIDDSQASTNAIAPMREALAQFVDTLHGHAEIGFVTVGERSSSLVEYTTDTGQLKKGIGRIFARPGSGAYLLDGIDDVAKGLQRRHATRPVIVVITMEGVEYSNLQYQTVLKQLDASGATMHVLAVGTPLAAQSDELRNRNMVLAEGTDRTGGRRDQLLSVSSIPVVMGKLADELLHQYVVTYVRPAALIPPEKLQVTVTRPGLTVHAPRRPGAQ